jgi:hypothetical protein
MEIIYLDKLRNEITEQQAIGLGNYFKRYIETGGIKKEERFFEGEFYMLFYYKGANESHQDILNIELDDRNIAIREVEIYGDYKLEKDFFYDINSVNVGFRNILYDLNNLKVGGEETINGSVLYEYTTKKYYDLTKDPESPIFKCYYRNDGSLRKIIYSYEYYNPDGQDEEVFVNTPSRIARLMSLTGISQELMDYYLSPDVTPNF